MRPITKYTTGILIKRRFTTNARKEELRDVLQLPVNKWTSVLDDVETRVNYLDSFVVSHNIVTDNWITTKMRPITKYSNSIFIKRRFSVNARMNELRDVLKPPVNEWTGVLDDVEKRVNYLDSFVVSHNIVTDNWIATKMRPITKYTTSILINRRFSTNARMEELRDVLQPPVNKWTGVLDDVERRVNYLDSFDVSRYIDTDNFVKLADLIIDYNTSSSTSKNKICNLIYGDTKYIQPWSLAVLLLTKSLNKPYDESTTKNIINVVEATEAFKIRYRIHSSIPNKVQVRDTKDYESNLNRKLTLLLGGHFFAQANARIAKIRNPEVAEIIFESVRDSTANVFVGDRDKDGTLLPGKPNASEKDQKLVTFDLSVPLDKVLGVAKREWVFRTMLDAVGPFASSCKAAMVLSGQGRYMQNLAYYFGCHLGLAWIISVENEQIYTDKFSATSAPVLFALNSNPELYKIVEKAKKDSYEVNFQDLRAGVLATNAIERSKELYREHVNKANELIDKIGHSENVDVMKRLIEI